MLRINCKYLFALLVFSALSCSSSNDDDNGVTDDVEAEETVTEETVIQESPLFEDGNSPTPSGKKWVKIENISDEFTNNSFDETKWENTSTRWIGRAPGIFKANTVSQADGNLMLTSYKLDEPEVINGETFTHAGSNIYSRNAAQVGTYVECRMKANKTFMSSTFWLINVAGEGEGCDKRVTELDIQECVGQITGTANFAKNFDETIHSNTHSRGTSCNETPIGSEGNNVATNGKVWEDYHVYGAWWKSPTEIEFYLDGKKVYTITPKAEFSLQMYLRLVVETYDWNPVPEDGGMTGSESERTTYYDWVRSWELKDE
ncbi:family 16 glycosylhydrolase [Cellulophaga omnivescoria]|uniref:family 16 glycosylhydrolase n=1 Tax=Cellulophaga omnivescoria TaxID=1888890 RepID=UPI000985EC56|nr:family 16 glycosylhydrolase [Cellulophaga omnivescoria]